MALHNQRMKCPACGSDQINKNGRRGDKQSYRCKDCGRQFVESYSSRGYSRDAKQICLNLYRSGMGFRAIERATGVSHNTVINWVRQEESISVDVAEPTETTELDELNQLSEEALAASQTAKNWLNNSSIATLVINRFQFLRLVTCIITSVCSALKHSKSCQPLIENHSLLVSLT